MLGATDVQWEMVFWKAVLIDPDQELGHLVIHTIIDCSIFNLYYLERCLLTFL